MQDSDHEIPAAARRHILLANAAFPAIVIVGLWTLFACAALFDIDLIALLKPRDRDSQGFKAEQVYFWLAIAGTVVCSGFAWSSIRRALHLASHGIPAACKVLSVGKVAVKGHVRVDYQYVADGATYKQSLTCPKVIAKEYESGAIPLEIVYDPQNPKRVMLMSDVFPKSTFAADEQDSQAS
jgi:hypothetical protein